MPPSFIALQATQVDDIVDGLRNGRFGDGNLMLELRHDQRENRPGHLVRLGCRGVASLLYSAGDWLDIVDALSHGRNRPFELKLRVRCNRPTHARRPRIPGCDTRSEFFLSRS